MYANIFAESSKFAAESISNYRTVISLTMEQSICEKYDTLLQQHAREAFRQSLYSTFSIAFGDSIALATQALLSWYLFLPLTTNCHLYLLLISNS
jgi:hypothetical protein